MLMPVRWASGSITPTRMPKGSPAPGAHGRQHRTRDRQKDGITGFTTNRIADVAGVGIGSLYQYFRDKDAILEIIVQRHLDELGTVLKAGSGH